MAKRINRIPYDFRGRHTPRGSRDPRTVESRGGFPGGLGTFYAGAKIDAAFVLCAAQESDAEAGAALAATIAWPNAEDTVGAGQAVRLILATMAANRTLGGIDQLEMNKTRPMAPAPSSLAGIFGCVVFVPAA